MHRAKTKAERKKKNSENVEGQLQLHNFGWDSRS